jgi:replication factor C subunit 3/5
MLDNQKKTIQNSIPWTEKYRPVDFCNIILDPINRTIFNNIIDHNIFPNLIIYGPPGTGKTTSVTNLIHSYQRKYSKQSPSKMNIIHLNASDERGIDIIRTQISQFVQSINMFGDGFKFVILDEVDYMTKNAQHALKNLLQTELYNVRFCLICNYICKIDDSLKNEFMCIRFNQLPPAEITKYIQNIATNENMILSETDILVIQNAYNNDIRCMVNFLQIHQSDINLHTLLLTNDTFNNLHNIFVNKSYSNNQLYTSIY